MYTWATLAYPLLVATLSSVPQHLTVPRRPVLKSLRVESLLLLMSLQSVTTWNLWLSVAMKSIPARGLVPVPWTYLLTSRVLMRLQLRVTP